MIILYLKTKKIKFFNLFNGFKKYSQMKRFLFQVPQVLLEELVDYLYSKGYDITVNIRSDNNGFFKKNIKTYRLNTNEIIKDITYFKGCKFDGIIHLAANYLKIHQPSDLPKMVQSNILLGTHLLECAVISGVTWFINTGSFFQNKNKSNYSPLIYIRH